MSQYEEIFMENFFAVVFRTCARLAKCEIRTVVALHSAAPYFLQIVVVLHWFSGVLCLAFLVMMKIRFLRGLPSIEIDFGGFVLGGDASWIV